MKILTKIVLVFLIVSLTACNNQLEIGSLLYEEQTGPDIQNANYRVVEIAYDENQFEELWEVFNFKGRSDDVYYEEFATLFLHTIENSCPKKITKVELNDDGSRLSILTTQKETNCDDYAISRSFVLKIEKEKLNDVESIYFEGQPFQLIK